MQDFKIPGLYLNENFHYLPGNRVPSSVQRANFGKESSKFMIVEVLLSH